MNNSNLQAAKRTKNDEFYTRIEDIEAEINHYKTQLNGKTIYCNCDNPEASMFWKYFHDHFKDIGLKELRATYKTQDGHPSYLTVYDGIRDHRHKLDGDGAFQSHECYLIMQLSDIIITNPPFSQFRAFIDMLVSNEKSFLIIGNQNAAGYKKIFPLIKNGKLWPGYSFNKTMEFIMPDDYELKGNAFIDDEGKKHGFVPGIAWFTNMDIPKRHISLIDTLQKSYEMHPENYPRYDNYDAINVDRTKDIPYDYNGKMGVPITFLDKFNPDEFEIIDINPHFFTLVAEGKEKPKQLTLKNVGKKDPYSRILIKRKELYTDEDY